MRRLLLLIPTFIFGCGSSVSVDTACTDAAASICTKLQNCAPALISSLYGDVATCQSRGKLTCPASLMAPSTSATASKLDDCAKSADMVSCGQLFTRDIPMACIPSPGKLAAGMACGDDAQCVGAYCKKATGQVCGVCSMRAAAGASCTIDDDCDYKLACANGTCVAYSMAGGTCDASHPCAAPLVCKMGTCAMPGGAGATCTPSLTGGDCDQTQGLYCHPMTRVCTAATFASAGQPCGFVNNGYALCSGSGFCKMSGASGTCEAPAADGATCDTTNGPKCLPPAECVSGACKLPNPASCM